MKLKEVSLPPLPAQTRPSSSLEDILSDPTYAEVIRDAVDVYVETAKELNCNPVAIDLYSRVLDKLEKICDGL